MRLGIGNELGSSRRSSGRRALAPRGSPEGRALLSHVAIRVILHGPMSKEERVAYNEALCRDLNERKAEWMRSRHPAAGFRCECWQMDCGARMPLSGREWEEVRSRANRFAVAPGHAAKADLEQVVKEYPHFWIVEKRGEAGDVAEQLEEGTLPLRAVWDDSPPDPR
jgi:hypothetical protein